MLSHWDWIYRSTRYNEIFTILMMNRSDYCSNNSWIRTAEDREASFFAKYRHWLKCALLWCCSRDLILYHIWCAIFILLPWWVKHLMSLTIAKPVSSAHIWHQKWKCVAPISLSDYSYPKMICPRFKVKSGIIIEYESRGETEDSSCCD